ncbi:MAG: hypothetical protein KGI62_01310 [Xanthomonadaceae bacterium]|nr:hypothetical protein [Xanthomonadaceae bacterium]
MDHQEIGNMPFETAVVKSQAKDGRPGFPDTSDRARYRVYREAAIMDDRMIKPAIPPQ